MANHILKRSLSSFRTSTHLKELLQARSKLDTFDRILTSKLKIINAPDNEGYCLGELTVESTHLNVGKVMHGGALTTLFDAVTTYALYNSSVRQPGVSVDIKLSFVKPAKKDDVILIEGRLKKAGSKLAFLDGNIYLKEDHSYNLNNNLLIATGQHIKFITQK